jgi:O-antigen ligase
VLTSGVTTRRAAAEPPQASQPNLSRQLSRALLAVLGLLLVEVLIEGWLVVLLGHRGIDADGNATVDPAELPKTIKSALYGLLLGLTIAKFAVDRTWYRLWTWADAALVILAVVMVMAGYVGGSSTVLIGQALFVYFRGAIVFYAMRALNPGWRAMRPLCWMAGAFLVVSAVIGLIQFLFGHVAYTWLGWVDLKWADENRPQGLLDHPNNLGHVMGLMVLGLLAWFVTADEVKKRWWILFGLTALALSIAQSRQSTVAVVAGIGLIALLRRGSWRRLIAATLIVVLLTAVPVVFSAESRNALAYRLGGLFNSFKMSGTKNSNKECEQNPRCSGRDGEVRVLFTKQGVKLWAARPILGYGVGQFGGIVAVKNDPQWNMDPRFQEVLGPDGFYLFNFKSTSVDVFWLHLLVEVGALGVIAYLIWMYLIVAPVIGAVWRRGPKMGGVRGSPGSGAILLWAASSFVFAILVAAWSPSLEDPLFPALMFAVLGFAWALLQQRPSEEPAGDEDIVRAGKAELT